MPYLVMIDRGYRGTAEAQFFDTLYGMLTFGEQLGGLDIVLRGSAVTAAVVPEDERPTLRVGSLVLENLPDPAESVRALLDAGHGVAVDAPDLAEFGLGAADLLPGVRCLDTTRLANRWSQYDGVWFL